MLKHNIQSGIALPITLLLLFVMTLVGVTSLRTSTLQEGMSANTRLRQVAFNAAETTLREAENSIIELSKNRNPSSMRQFFFNGKRPIEGVSQRGDDCTNGFCVPLKHETVATGATKERWFDNDVLDVWNDPDKHQTYAFYGDPLSEMRNEGVFEPPMYIIELLGHFALESQGKFQTNCPIDEATGKAKAPNDKWPFCMSDPATYRITVRATAGPRSREASAMLQSTIRIP